MKVGSIRTILIDGGGGSICLGDHRIARITVLVTVYRAGTFASRLRVNGLRLAFGVYVNHHGRVVGEVIIRDLTRHVGGLHNRLRLFCLLRGVVMLTHDFRVFRVVAGCLSGLVLRLSSYLAIRLKRAGRIYRPV